MESLNGRVIAITGATAGIGAATAHALVAEGALVALGARRTGRLAELEETLGDHAVTVEMDVRDPDGSQQLVAAAIERFGRLDSLVANAGIGA